MNKPNTITTPSGDRMVAIPFEKYERLIEAGITVTNYGDSALNADLPKTHIVSSAETRGWPGRRPAMTAERVSPRRRRHKAPTRRANRFQFWPTSSATKPLDTRKITRAKKLISLTPSTRFHPSSPSIKNFPLSFFPKSVSLTLVPRSIKRGVSRSSRTLNAGCGGRIGVAARYSRADEQP